uniref:Putative ovule protein n=1 Tax=Solanum chacoense TaxID=4108 RepID=A0A0V0H5M3_SOLCH
MKKKIFKNRYNSRTLTIIDRSNYMDKRIRKNYDYCLVPPSSRNSPWVMRCTHKQLGACSDVLDM